MKNHVFDRNDQSKILLTRFVKGANMLNMPDAEEIIALPTFLDDPADT